MDWNAALPYVLALGGGTGLGAGLKALTDTILAVRSGVSAREGKRKMDIVQQRDEAEDDATAERKRANAEMVRADWCELNMRIARSNEQRVREHAAELRLALMGAGALRRDQLPKWPDMEETVPRSRLIEALAEARKELK